MRSVAAVTSNMCEGELFQLKKKNKTISIGEYYEIIELKTALLFAASLSLGALISGATPGQVKNLSEFGLSLGKLFQITDDILDYVGTEKNLKKDVGNDFHEGKQTIPLIFALMQANESQKSTMLELIEKKEDFPAIMSYVNILGGIEASISEAKRLASFASEKLMDMPQNRFSEILNEIPKKVLSRVVN
jgi:octaprenyl-diphosphate synthase